MIPGWGASGVSYFPIYDKLRNEFEITVIDVLGFGCSGRPELQDFTVKGV